MQSHVQTDEWLQVALVAQFQLRVLVGSFVTLFLWWTCKLKPMRHGSDNM